jgi:hypothetical protein
MFGYQVAVPGQGKLLNGLRWDASIDPVEWQSAATIYQRATAAGIRACHVAPGSFRGSGLTTAFARGVEYIGAGTLGETAAEAQQALAGGDRVLVTAYHGHLDATGHTHGVSSAAWRYQLSHVDKLAEQLATGLPDGSVLYVTADHGMVDVGPDERVDVDDTPALRDGVALLGGEPRARHVYAEPGAAGDVQAAWKETLGKRASVLSRDEAITEGLFGEVRPELAPRIGDVVVVPGGTTALVATKAEPRESALIGMHGSLTQDEQLVPLLMLSTA